MDGGVYVTFLTLKSFQDLKTTIKSVAYDASRCLSIYKGLFQFKGKSLKSALTNEVALKCTLGGFQGDKHAENSLYNFCNRLFGLNVDVNKLVSLLKQTDLQEASQFIEIQFLENTKFVRGIEEFLSAVKQIGYNYYLSTDLADPKIYVETVVNDLLKLSPNYSEHMLFLIRTFRIARTYLNQLYPESEYPERGSVLEFLGFRKLIDPGGPERVQRDYAIYGYPRGSLGWNMLRVMNAALDILTLPEIKEYFDLEDEREKFIERVRAQLSRPKISVVDRIDELIKSYWERLDKVANSTRKKYECEIRRLIWNDYLKPSIPYKLYPERPPSHFRSCSFESEIKDGVIVAYGDTMDFPSFVDAIAPHMSVGLAFADVLDGKVWWWVAWPT